MIITQSVKTVFNKYTLCVLNNNNQTKIQLVSYNTNKSQVKVGDFGLVTSSSHQKVPDLSSFTPRKSPDMNHTQQVGTRMYMAPEQV